MHRQNPAKYCVGIYDFYHSSPLHSRESRTSVTSTEMQARKIESRQMKALGLKQGSRRFHLRTDHRRIAMGREFEECSATHRDLRHSSPPYTQSCVFYDRPMRQLQQTLADINPSYRTDPANR